MKRSTKVILVFLTTLVVLGIVMLFNPPKDVDNPTPTSPPNTTTPSAAPTEEAEPTAEPTKEPAATETPTPTEEPVHEHTWVKKEEPATCTSGGRTWEECECGEVQNEQFGTEFTHGELVYTVTAEPTEETEGAYMETCILCGTVINQGTLPVLTHEHVWEQKEVEAACTEDGKAWEECKCGAVQNEVVTKDALGHGELTYHVATEPSLTEEGSYENICQVCGAMVSTGKIPKLTPIPTPTSTPTPKPTATPTPSPKPTAVPTKTAEQEKCEHKNYKYSYVKNEATQDYDIFVVCKDCKYTFNEKDCDHSIETRVVPEKIDGIYQDALVCRVCNTVLEVYYATPTPTPTPLPPVPTAEPLPPSAEEATAGKAVVETKTESTSTTTTYSDNTKVISYDNGDIIIYYPDGSEFIQRQEFTQGSLPTGNHYKSSDSIVQWNVIKSELDTEHYYFYRSYGIDNPDGSVTKYTVLCNSDGSLNELSNVEYNSLHWGVSDSDGAKAIVIYAFDKTKTDVSISISTNRIYTYVADTSNGYKETIIKEYTWKEYYDMVLK